MTSMRESGDGVESDSVLAPVDVTEPTDTEASVIADEVPVVEPVVLTDADIAVFLAAEPTARAALEEITPPDSIGELVGHEATPDGAVLLSFRCLSRAYTGWLWTAALGRATDESEPTVLEVELLPGDGALTSPEWRPWDERYAEYKAHLDADAASDTDVTEESDTDLDDEPHDRVKVGDAGARGAAAVGHGETVDDEDGHDINYPVADDSGNASGADEPLSQP